MGLTQTEKLILFSLGQFYQSINQPLVAKPLTLRTSKITFIELMLESSIISKQERALYKNLESLEQEKFITYNQRMILFTSKGLKELERLNQEVKQYQEIIEYFHNPQKTKRKLQTMIS